MAQAPGEPTLGAQLAAWFDDTLVKVVAALVIAAATLALKAVRAWISARVTSLLRVVQVAGDWDTSIQRAGAEAPANHEVVSLRQFGSWVWGVAARVDGAAATRYRLRGEVFGDKVSLTYRDAAAFGNDVGAILLKVSADGTRLDGFEIGCNLGTNAPESLNYHWTRRPKP